VTYFLSKKKVKSDVKLGKSLNQHYVQECVFVVSNCQSLPIANALKNLTKNLYIGHASYLTGLEKVVSEINNLQVEITLVTSMNEDQLNYVRSRLNDKMKKIIKIPEIYFPVFHPDQTYIKLRDGSILKSPIGDYHSKITLYSYLNNISPQDCVSYFQEETYQRVGYFDLWTESLIELERRFASSDLQFNSLEKFLSGHQIFMHSFNHPNVCVIQELSKSVCNILGLRFPQLNYPQDLSRTDFLHGPGLTFPVFPEIANMFGQEGEYFFWGINGEQFDLNQFVEESFKIYASHYQVLLEPEEYFSKFFLERIRGVSNSSLL
jgi:hypothetical protein